MYQVPTDLHTVDDDTSDAVQEDYKNLVYFMDVDYAEITSSVDPAGIPQSFSLEQNYPNPFNPATTIAFSVAVAGTYDLEVFNLLGEKVLTLYDKYTEVGNYSIEFNASALSSGIYFYKLSNGMQILTQKALLLK